MRERYRLEQEKINLNYFKLSVSDFAAQVKLTDDDIKKFMSATKKRLKSR